jgi:hypothetical protein
MIIIINIIITYIFVIRLQLRSGMARASQPLGEEKAMLDAKALPERAEGGYLRRHTNPSRVRPTQASLAQGCRRGSFLLKPPCGLPGWALLTYNVSSSSTNCVGSVTGSSQAKF